MEDIKSLIFSPYTWFGLGVAAIGGVWWARLTPTTSNITLAFAVISLTITAVIHPWTASQHFIVRTLFAVATFSVASLAVYFTLWTKSASGGPDLSLTTEEATLCPRPLRYSLRQVEVPPSTTRDNYATELTIEAVREPMFRVTVFVRTLYSQLVLTDSPATGISATEHGTDPYSFQVSSTKPAQRYKVVVHTSEWLRVICINQHN